MFNLRHTAQGLTFAGALAVLLFAFAKAPQASCPAGYRPWSKDPSKCIAIKHPEPYWEIELRQREWMAGRSAPFKTVAAGAFSSGLAERQRLAQGGPKVDGTEGAWQQYGTGPLINNSADYPSTSGLGLVHAAGRIDNLAYDFENRRLFATKGTGGIWMSTDLGDSWRSIGDGLPSQIIAAVAWSRANGGTLVALSGDPAMGSYTYTGFGAFYSRDLGATWQKAQGVPDGAPGFAIEVDPSNPNIVYAATMLGLFRSTDGGVTYSNVNLPTGHCVGLPGAAPGLLANVVTDVVIKAPGGAAPATALTDNPPAGSVLAVVGWRSGKRQNRDGSVQSPCNGLYRSSTGAPNTFEWIKGPPTGQTATGFAPQDRIGRVEIAAATGPLQDHNYVYAIVQDAVALNGGLEMFDSGGLFIQDPRPIGPSLPILGPIGAAGGTNLHGVYVSSDFGRNWVLMADQSMIAKNPSTGSALVVIGQAIGYEPGVQAWYNLFIAPDPTKQTQTGIPTRLVFGLEEVWQNEVVGQPLNGPTPFKVIGRYFSGETCMLLGLDLPECPTARPPTTGNTTHPDQHAAIWIPDGSGGVTLAVGNDGGFYRQHVGASQELNNGGWGDGNQNGFNTLLPYDVAMAKDGTAYAGLQDNGHLKITPDGKQYSIYGGDGTFAEVNPDNSAIAYESTPGANIRVTTDGGKSWRNMAPPITNARFVNPFEMDPTDANHLVTAGRQVAETLYGPNTGLTGSPWVRVFDMGTRSQPGNPAATASAADPANVVSAIAVRGDAVYVAFCGPCNSINQQVSFGRGLATNVGGPVPPKRGTTQGWHIASARGLPNRYIMGLAIDPSNPRIVYVAMGGYSVRWIPPGSLGDENQNIGTGHLFRSTDAGETFTDISGNLPDLPATSIVLRGKQLIVGTDAGVFATDTKGGTTFAPLVGLPVVPISTMQIWPGNCDRLVAATYGRGIYTYQFARSLPGKNPCAVKDETGVLSDFARPEQIHSPTHAWWGGSASHADNHLTRAIAVPANAARLKFWAWYNLEDGYDWAYALVSTDNGATWTSLVTTAANGSGTTPLDPIGTSGGVLGGSKRYPNGLTGVSGQPPNFSGQNLIVPRYAEHTADLSPYAGKSILLRFAYTSDPAANLDGFFVDDVSIVDLLGAVLFSDNMEVQSTWQPSAFRWMAAGAQ